MRIIDRYILKTHFGPFFFGLSVITFVFIMDFIFRSLDLFIGKGVAFLVVLEFFVLSLGHMFALIIPMAVMPATLMAFGQLSSDNEITALKASGISLYRMILPVLAASVLLTGGLIWFHNAVLPESNHRLMNLSIDIYKMRPTIEIRENQFSESIGGYTIYVREKNDRTGDVEDIRIVEKRRGGIPTTTIAARGKMYFIEDENVLRFELQDGEIHEMPDPNDINTYRKTEFSQFTLNIQDTDRQLKRSERTGRTDREMNAAMMHEKVLENFGSIEVSERHMHQIALEPFAEALTPLAPARFAAYRDRRPSGPDPAREREGRRRGSKVNQAAQVLQILEHDANEIEMYRSQISKYGVEIHKKFSIPFACIIFVLVGAPLAIRSGKKGMTMSIGFSILFFLVYYMFLISGEKLADRRFVEPWLAMWLPNIVLLAAAILLLRSTVREAQTINWNRINLLRRWRRENP